MVSTSDIELPSDVCSDVDCHAADLPPDVDVELPPDVASDNDVKPAAASSSSSSSMAWHCSCRRDCRAGDEAVLAAGTAARLEHLSCKDRSAKLFEAVKSQLTDADGLVRLGKASWSFQDKRVCRPFWEWSHAAGHGTVDKYAKLIRQGHTSLPSNDCGVRPRDQYFRADEWFLNLYRRLGEPLAVEDPALIDEAEHEVITDTTHPLWNMSINVGAMTAGKHIVQKRYLNPGCFEDIWLLYQVDNPADKVSKSTMLKVGVESNEHMMIEFSPYLNHVSKYSDSACDGSPLIQRACERHQKIAAA